MNLMADFRFAARSLRSRPGTSLFAVLSLAAGMAAAIAIYCVIDGVMLRGLPYADSARLIELRELADDGHSMNLAAPNFADLASGLDQFESMAMYNGGNGLLRSGDATVRVPIAWTDGDLFRVLGTAPLLGRYFTAATHEPLAVISHELWQSMFNGRADVLGQPVTIDGEPYTVAAVMPAGLAFPQGTRAWIPLPFEIGISRSAHNWRALGRLKASADLGQARLAASALATRLKAEHGRDTDAVDFGLTPLAEAIAAPVRSGLLLLAAGTAFLMLIAITNTTNLLLALNASRSREFAVRAALGASDLRLGIQVLFEGLVIVALATAAALVLAAAGLEVLVHAAGESLPRAQEVHLDAGTFGLAALAGIGIALVATAAVVWSMRRQSTISELRESGRGQSPGRGQLRTRAVLLVAQTALTTVLLIGAGLLGQRFLELLAVDPGFEAQGAVSVQVSQAWTADAAVAAGNARRTAQLMDEFGRIPGVTVVGGISSLPLTNDGANGGFWDGSVTSLEKSPPPPIGQAEYRVASPGYFKAAGIPLLKGREFSATDRAEGEHVAVVSESMAKSTWGARDPIGQRIQFGNMDGDMRLLTVVGVASDVRERSLDRMPAGAVYVDLVQRPKVAAEFNILVRSSVPVATLLPALRKVMLEKGKGIPYSLLPLTELRANSLADRRFGLILLGAFSTVAFVLAVSGLYALMAFAVGQRQHEFALRQALGSSRRRIRGLVLGGGMRLGLAGVVFGLVLATVMSRIAGSEVHGLPPLDPWTLAGVCALLLATLLLACLVPASRACAVAPRDALG
jgi:putative ABC transport system permease protein